ncbi:MAG: aldolase [Rhodospirillales bacterium]|nr:aldolase [Rhodospirillales bacterium]
MPSTNSVPNRMKERLAKGEIVLSMSVRMSRTTDVVAIAETAGFDALFIDMQHSALDMDATSQLCVASRLAGVTPLVRPPSHDPHTAGRLLDTGAQGLIFPDVNTAAQAKAVAAACRFPPRGRRSMAGPAVQMGYRALPAVEQTALLNDATLVIAMVESAEGLANADAIAATDGVDIILIGSNDLCADLGIHGQFDHAKVHAAYETVAKACRAHGKHLGVGGIRNDIPLLTKFVRMGARFLSAGTDTAFLLAYAKAQATELRAIKPSG